MKETYRDVGMEAFKLKVQMHPKPWTVTDLNNIYDDIAYLDRWGAFIEDSGLFTEDQCKYLIGLDDMYTRIFSKEQRDRATQVYETDKKLKLFRDEHADNYKENHLAYLKNELVKLTSQIDKINAKVNEYEDKDMMLEAVIFKNMHGIHDVSKKRNKIRAMIKYAEGGLNTQIDKSTIELARNTPFNKILKVDSRGYASCPFHNEKTSSFHITPNNRGHCFGCGKTVDTITFMIDIKRMQFNEAVNYLISL